MVVCTCALSTAEVEIEGSGIQDNLPLYSEFKVSLEHMRLFKKLYWLGMTHAYNIITEEAEWEHQEFKAISWGDSLPYKHEDLSLITRALCY